MSVVIRYRMYRTSGWIQFLNTLPIFGLDPALRVWPRRGGFVLVRIFPKATQNP